jgi:DNA-binding NarL/FixJ family response regulator
MSTTGMPTILIVEDHLLVRQGLRHMLGHEFRGVSFGEARNCAEALTQVEKNPWDLITLDIGLPDRDGFYLLAEILRRQPRAHVLVLADDAAVYPARAQQLGALGYVSKNAARASLLRAIRAVLAGKSYFETSRRPESQLKPPAKAVNLSAREYRVMLAFAAGKRSSDIAAEMGLSIKTVSTYKRRVLNKLRINSVADMVRHVIENKLTDIASG